MPENDQTPPTASPRPTTARELTEHLAKTLVQRDVIDPMNKTGWQEMPPTTGDPDNPATSVAPPVPTPTPSGTTPTEPAPGTTANVPTSPPTDIDWEALKDPNTGLYMGKYTSVPEAVKGIGHAVNMAKDALAKNASLQKELETLRSQTPVLSQSQPAASPAAVSPVPTFNPATRAEFDAANAKLDGVLSRVAEEGGLLDESAAKALKDTLREVVSLGARTVAEEVVVSREAAKSADDAKWNAVDAYMAEKYPGSQNFADEMGLFVQSNPLINSAVKALSATGNEIQAAELAWIEFDKARNAGTAAASLAAAVNTEVRMEAADQVRREAVDAARRDAGVPTSSAGGVHESPNTGPSRAEIEAAAAGMRAYGAQPGNPAAQRWRELVIPLPKDVFGPR